jgi:hypothetical protein
MSSRKERSGQKGDRPIQKLARPENTDVTDKVLCKACNKEFALEAYFDHVYDSDECYKAYLASEKKEMSKQ